MQEKKIFFLTCLLFCLRFLGCCVGEAKLHHLKQNGVFKTDGCVIENCGPPFDYEIIPNPPSVGKQFTIRYGLTLVADVFKAYLDWSVEGPNGFHLKDITPWCVKHRRVRQLCNHLKGYYVHGNFTDHLPLFIRSGCLYSGNATLVNDEDDVIFCSRLSCTFDP